MSVRATAPAHRERGYSMVALLASVSVMLVLMTAAVPAWRYVVKNEKEQELFFRGGQIADAIQRYQRKKGGQSPPSLEVLVKERFLRQAYKDPMTKDGEWRLLRPGEPLLVAPRRQRRDGAQRDGAGARDNPREREESARGSGPGADNEGLPGASTTGPAGRPATVIGPFIGVASRSTERSLRIFNGMDSYDQWLFVAGMPRLLGRPPRGTQRPGLPPFPQTGLTPPPPPNPRGSPPPQIPR